MPLLPFQIEREIRRLRLQHFLSRRIKGSRSALLINGIFKITCFSIRNRTERGGDRNTANVTGVGTFVILIIEPDVKALRRDP